MGHFILIKKRFSGLFSDFISLGDVLTLQYSHLAQKCLSHVLEARQYGIFSNFPYFRATKINMAQILGIWDLAYFPQNLHTFCQLVGFYKNRWKRGVILALEYLNFSKYYSHKYDVTWYLWKLTLCQIWTLWQGLSGISTPISNMRLKVCELTA